MSQEFFNGFKHGFELGARFKYLQVNLLTLSNDFDKVHQKSKQRYLYDLWTKVNECQSNIEELVYEEDKGDSSRLDRLASLGMEFNEYRQKYRVLLEQYNELKKSRPARSTRKRKAPVAIVAEEEEEEEEIE